MELKQLNYHTLKRTLIIRAWPYFTICLMFTTLSAFPRHQMAIRNPPESPEDPLELYLLGYATSSYAISPLHHSTVLPTRRTTHPTSSPGTVPTGSIKRCLRLSSPTAPPPSPF